MLVREPEKRATLSEIATDPWVAAGEGITVEDFDTPLVAKEQLSEEDRTAIVQKMVNGSIATKEQILESLETNDYNHITATYYLLAERKLKAKRYYIYYNCTIYIDKHRSCKYYVLRKICFTSIYISIYKIVCKHHYLG